MERDFFNLLVLFVVVAAMGMLVTHAQGTSQIIGASTGGFGQLLSIVQNPGGTGMASGFGGQNYASQITMPSGG